jgi:N-methylhydantoinase B
VIRQKPGSSDPRSLAERFERFGGATVEACFQAILDKCRDIYRYELLPKIAAGEYAWEDYVEHDGVSAPRLHKLALRMIKRGERITLDFSGTVPQSPGPINWPADYAGGAFLIKWIAPIPGRAGVDSATTSITVRSSIAAHRKG